jgi:cytochrome c biogenesis protein CcdA
MLRLIGLVVSIGLADSLNPTTIAPALYLASGENCRARVSEFTLGVFGVYFLGGALVALGPGQLLLALVPKPHAHTRYILEIIAGVALLIAAAYLWLTRHRLARRELPALGAESKSSAILGATISAVELPTAFPYFAAIAAIVGSGLHPVKQLVLLVLFNVCFVLPLLAIIATLTFADDKADRVLATGRRFLQRNWPLLLSGLLGLAGVFILVLGVTGLAGGGHSDFAHDVKHFRRMLHP